MKLRSSGFVLMSLLGCRADDSPSSPSGEGLPASYALAQIAPAALAPGLSLAPGDLADSSAVLAWVETTDDRPLDTSRCIVWQECHDDGGATVWLLTELYRHPRSEDRWWPNAVTDTAHRGQRIFTERPSLEDACEFLRDSWWTLEPGVLRGLGPGEVVVRAGLCEDAWRRTIGALPQGPLPPGSSGGELDGLGYLGR